MVLLLFKTTIFWLHRISSFSVLLPIIISLLLFTKLGKTFKALAYLLYITAIFQIAGILINTYGTPPKGQYNLFLYHILILIEFSLLAWIYKIQLQDLIPAKLFSFLTMFFIVCSISNTIYVMKPSHSLLEFYQNFRYIAKFNNYAQLLENFLLMSFAFIYFYKLLKEMKVESLEKEAFFWFNIGILTYYASKFTLDILNNFISEYFTNLKHITWSVHSIANILLHIFYSLAIWRNSRR